MVRSGLNKCGLNEILTAEKLWTTAERVLYRPGTGDKRILTILQNSAIRNSKFSYSFMIVHIHSLYLKIESLPEKGILFDRQGAFIFTSDSINY